jgi:hypothetical protein
MKKKMPFPLLNVVSRIFTCAFYQPAYVCVGEQFMCQASEWKAQACENAWFQQLSHYCRASSLMGLYSSLPSLAVASLLVSVLSDLGPQCMRRLAAIAMGVLLWGAMAGRTMHAKRRRPTVPARL